MREIIHIQAGLLSNYTGTHYWNTQENYFVYDEGDISITDYNISFKEGRDKHVCPLGGHLSSYARFVEGTAKRHDSALLAMGLEDNEVRELVSALWDIVVDEYGENKE